MTSELRASAGPHDDRLAAYQAAMLDTLHDGSDGDAMVAEIGGAAHAAGFAVGHLDAVLAEVAADLTRTWGRLAD